MTFPAVVDGAGRVMDQIRLTGLTVRGYHGVFEQERRDGQDFVVDVTVHLDTRPAAATDDLTRTVNYADLAEALAGIVAGEPVDLIETLAERLAARALASVALEAKVPGGPRVDAVDVTVHKPSAPIPLTFSDVTVSVRRERQDAGTRAVLALGSNLGDRREILQSAVDALAAAPGVRVVAVSALVETSPVGGPEQPDYLNAVVLVDTTLSSHELLDTCQRIEREHGRERSVRWGPRTLDVDIVDHQGFTCSDDDLHLPHPHAASRAFVLVPWLTVDPDATLPGPGPEALPVGIRTLAACAPDLPGLRFPALTPLRVPA
ncbi:MAG: dihydroneopterin aldolase / 2-amino-4-hydroxy-6-hydroxymethyldihydropteridine diphosphokinase [Actinomycetota bacterium]|nr:dihydroneopterin aldolase / 2-amino-4-hydroxy-6-hydroxymethyldihydropteridine diphosphokinase [Actinomycetota bacterium]